MAACADDDRPPIHGTRARAVEWLERPEFRVAALADRIAYSVVYSEQGSAPGAEALRTDYWPTGARTSWLGGPAGGTDPESWPHRADGRPLAHVATFDLRDAHDAIDPVSGAHWPERIEWLPGDGLLQVFHDLHDTWGLVPADGAAGGWCIRWVAAPDRSVMTDGPAGLDLPTDACQVLTSYASFSFPSATDAIGARSEVFAATSAATEEYQRMWSWQRFRDRDAAPLPVTHLGGTAQHGELLPRLDILPACLPLQQEGDRHRLVAEIESWTTLNGWFGDAGTLQVWMRDSDLSDRAFDRAWCIVRTD